MKVSELMTTDVETVERNDELSLADDIMKMTRVRHLPVMDEGRLVGVLSQRDLFLAALSTAMGFSQKASKAFLKSVPVKEAMADDLVTVGPSEDVKKGGAAHEGAQDRLPSRRRRRGTRRDLDRERFPEAPRGVVRPLWERSLHFWRTL